LKRHFARIRVPSGQGKYLVISSLILALLVPTLALAANGDPMIAGGRTTFTKITRVLGDSTTYATQQSNLHAGDGGAARYGCRSSAVNEFCLLSKNTGGGGSFRFQSLNSLLGGSIEVNPPSGKTAADAKPFTTNALVTADGKTNGSRTKSVADTNIVHTTAGVYCFTGLAAQPQTASVTLDGVAGETSVDTTTNNPGAACNNATGIQLIVRTYDSGGTLTDKPFYVRAD
jgi:hypothetical protein